MQSNGNNHKQIFFNWLLCLSVLLSIIALYISLSYEDKIQSLVEKTIQEHYSDTKKSADDFRANQQRLETLNEKLLKQQNSILAMEKEIENLNNFIAQSRGTDGLGSHSSSPLSPNATQQNVNPIKASQAGSTYTIKSGDTFSKIAVTFGVPLQALIEANRLLNPRSLKVGQEIIIPK